MKKMTERVYNSKEQKNLIQKSNQEKKKYEKDKDESRQKRNKEQNCKIIGQKRT